MVHCWGYYEKEKTEMVIYYRAADADYGLCRFLQMGPNVFQLKKILSQIYFAFCYC